MGLDGEKGGRWWRAALAVLALAVTAGVIYEIFSSGFGRTRQTLVEQGPTPVAVVPTAVPVATRVDALAVVSDNFWLTYLPAGLDRTGGGAIEPEPGVEGGWARFGSGTRYVEAQVEHGTVAASWDTYRKHAALRDARNTTIRGKPAMIGTSPNGGRMIVWLERVGTGAWIRVSDSLSKELLPIAASVKAPVGD